MIRFGKKLTILSTRAIKHQLEEMMRVSDRNERLARESKGEAIQVVPAGG